MRCRRAKPLSTTQFAFSQLHKGQTRIIIIQSNVESFFLILVLAVHLFVLSSNLNLDLFFDV